MKNRLVKIINRLKAGQAGQAMVLILIFFLLGSLTITPVLLHMATTLKTGTKYEAKTYELFTADAGIETGLWRIKTGFMGPSYDPCDFETVWPYETDEVNGLSADVLVQNVWIPTKPTLEELATLGLNKNVLRAIAGSKKLEITGTAGGDSSLPFYVKIDFRPDAGDNLTIKSIGVWLPQGFTYAGDCSLTPAPDFEHDSLPPGGPAPGGSAVVWEYEGPFYPLFTDFDPVSENETLSITFNFRYEPPPDNPSLTPTTAIAWVNCEMHDAWGNVVLNPYAAENVPIAWDKTTRYYKIKSIAGTTKIETYSSKSQMTNLGNGIPGDYVATGNSLMTDTNSDNRRDYLYTSGTSATVSTIPANGDVVYAYLYWSGYQQGTEQHKLQDYCTNFNNWVRSTEAGSQTRVPTSDNETSGSWDTPPCWDEVDETSAGDGDYMTGTTDTGGYKLFGFAPFSVPNQPITNLTVYIRARDSTNPIDSDIRPAIKVNGTVYAGGSSHEAGRNFTSYSYPFSTNPATGSAWTYADINGTGSNPLQAFGVYSEDLNPDVQVSMVYAQVNYASDSIWSINSDKFQAQGAASASDARRTLTFKNSIDLSSCIPGCVAVTWDQTKNSYLESTDALYFSFSGDGGYTWSDNIISGNGTAMSSPYFYIIPNKYVTGNFKMRFYTNLNDTAEIITIDNIKVSYLPPDNSVVFKVNDVQYSLSDNGTPQTGGEIAASTSQAFPSLWAGSFVGYSYACYRDVTAIVTKYPEDGLEHHTGNYKYTVGNVEAYEGHDLSYAGWSLIIIYGSPSSAGHYLYITDAFSFNPADSDVGVNLDFDRDGAPGGDIKGFVIPKPITDKQGQIAFPVAAKLTCFVGEGDSGRTGDYIQITGQQSEITRRLADNSWNGVSTQSGTLDGIDIDTFEVLWSDGVLTANDKSLHVDLWGGGGLWDRDAYNLIYFILSVQNETTTSGTGHYTIMPD